MDSGGVARARVRGEDSGGEVITFAIALLVGMAIGFLLGWVARHRMDGGGW